MLKNVITSILWAFGVLGANGLKDLYCAFFKPFIRMCMYVNISDESQHLSLEKSNLKQNMKFLLTIRKSEGLLVSKVPSPGELWYHSSCLLLQTGQAE